MGCRAAGHAPPVATPMPVTTGTDTAAVCGRLPGSTGSLAVGPPALHAPGIGRGRSCQLSKPVGVGPTRRRRPIVAPHRGDYPSATDCGFYVGLLTGGGMALHRRRLLALLAAGAGTAAGCQDLPPGPDAAADGTPADATPTPRPASAVGCPDYDRRDPGRVVCSQDPPDRWLVLEPEPGTAELPTAAVDCRLENTLDEPFGTNHYDWSLHRYKDGAWHHLGPYVVPMPLHHLPPGETHVRRLLVDNTDLERVRPPQPETATDGDGSVWTAGRHGLGPGAYTVAIRSDTEGEDTVYSASFALEGDPVPLVEPETMTARDAGRGPRDGARRTALGGDRAPRPDRAPAVRPVADAPPARRRTALPPAVRGPPRGVRQPGRGRRDNHGPRGRLGRRAEPGVRIWPPVRRLRRRRLRAATRRAGRDDDRR